MKTERVVLIGLRCSGKTSVGKLVAEKLARRGGPGSLRPAPPAPDNAPGSLRPAPPAPDNAPGWDFLDADEELVRRAGRAIKEIFEADGEPAFRALEKETLADLCKRKHLVLAAGGGAVLDPENVANMKRSALVVHLDAPVEVLWERMQRDPVTGLQRPALTDLDGRSEMAAVAEKRASLYEAARDMVVDTGRLGQEEAAKAIAEAVEN